MTTTERPPTVDRGRGRYEKWVLQVACEHTGAETCECRRQALLELLAQAEADKRPLVILPPGSEPQERDPDALGALGAWAALGIVLLLIAILAGRQLWLVIFG